jgi:hypothetical protein
MVAFLIYMTTELFQILERSIGGFAGPAPLLALYPIGT